MRILLTGSLNNLLPIVRSLIKTQNRLTIINDNHHECEKLADLTDHVVIYGDPAQKETLAEAHIRNFDLVVALTDHDADNLLICDLAKRYFDVKRSLASVTCPALEDVLERLGVDEALSYPEITLRIAAGHLIV
jgi:trk system potassium uptake protein TrkA